MKRFELHLIAWRDMGWIFKQTKHLNLVHGTFINFCLLQNDNSSSFSSLCEILTGTNLKHLQLILKSSNFNFRLASQVDNRGQHRNCQGCSEYLQKSLKITRTQMIRAGKVTSYPFFGTSRRFKKCLYSVINGFQWIYPSVITHLQGQFDLEKWTNGLPSYQTYNKANCRWEQDKISIMIGLTFSFTKFFFSCNGNNPLLLVSSSKRQLCVKCRRQRKSCSFLVFPPEELNNEERLQLERRKSMTISFFSSVFSSMLCDLTIQHSHLTHHIGHWWTLQTRSSCRGFVAPLQKTSSTEDIFPR